MFSRMFARRRLRALAARYEVPAFSAVATQLLDELQSEEVDLRRVTALVAADPGLSVRVLAMANTPCFGFRKKIDDLPRAVALLGTATLEGIVLGAMVGSALPRGGRKTLDLHAFWQVSAVRALLARELARVLAPTLGSRVFTAGLLLDIGMPILADHRPEDYARILAESRAGRAPIAELEREAFGVDHAEVGAWAAAAWGLPDTLAEAVEAHHAPEDAELPAPLVAVSDLGPHREKPEDLEPEAERAAGITGVPADVVATFFERAAEQADALAAALA